MARKAKAKKEDTTPVKEKSNKATTAKVTPSKSNKTSRKANTKATSTAKRQIEHSLNSETVSKANSQGVNNSINKNKDDREEKKNDSNPLVKESDNKAIFHSSTLSLPSVKVEELINRPANSPIVSLSQLRSLSLPTGARINIRSTHPQTSTLSSSSTSSSFPTSSSAVAKEVALALNPANSKMQQQYQSVPSSSSVLSTSLQLKNTLLQNDHNTTRDINNNTTDMSTRITSSSPPLPSSPAPSMISVASTEMESSATARPIRKPRSTFIWHNKRSEENSNTHKSVKAQRNPRYASNNNKNNNKHRKPLNFSLQPTPPPPLIPHDTKPQEKINILEKNSQESEKVKSINVHLSTTSHTLEPHAIASQTPEQHTSSTSPALLPSSTSAASSFSSPSSSCASNGKALEQSVIGSANKPTNELNDAISSSSLPSSAPPVPVSVASHPSLPLQHDNNSTLVLSKDRKELSVSTQKMMPSTSASSVTITTTPIPAVVAEEVAKYTAASSAQEQTQPNAAVEYNNNNNNNNNTINVDAKFNVDNNQNVFHDGWSSLPVNDNATNSNDINGNDIIVDNNISNNNYYELIQMQNKNVGYEYNWEECSEEEQQQYFLQMQRHLLSSEQRLQPSPLPPSTSPLPPPPGTTTTNPLFVPYAEEDNNNEEAEVVQQNSSWPVTASEYLLYLQRREEMMRNEEENNASYTNYDNNNGYDMYSTPANNFNATNYNYTGENGGDLQISNELQNNLSNVHDDHHLLTSSTITSSCFTPPCTSATNTNNVDNLIVNDVNNNGNSNIESNDAQSSRSKPSSIAQYRLTMMRLRAAQRPSSSSTDSDYLTAIKKQTRTRIVQDARNGEVNKDMSNTSTFTSNNNNNNNYFSNSTNNNNIEVSAGTADCNVKTNTSKNRHNKNKNNRNKSMNSSFNSRYSSNSITNTNSSNSSMYNSRTDTKDNEYQANKSRSDAKSAQNTKHGNKRKKQQSTVMPEHLPHTWSNVDQHAQKRIRSDYSTNEDNEEANAEKEKCNRLHSTTCDISANYNNMDNNNSNTNNSTVSWSTLSDLRRCIANRHEQWSNNNNNCCSSSSNIVMNYYSNVNSATNEQEQPKSQPEMSSSSAANSFICANNNTSISPATLSAPLAHLLGSWNSSDNIANAENGTWTSYRTFSPAHLSTPAISASSVTSMVNVGNNNASNVNYNNYNNNNNNNNMVDQIINANGTCANVADVKLYQPEEDVSHSVDRTLPISQRNLLAMKPNLSHVGNDTIFRDEAVIGAGNVVSEEPNSFAALRNAWIAASAALATSTPRSEWQLPSPPPTQNEQNGIEHAMYTSPTPSPQPPPELTGTVMNADSNHKKSYSAYQRTVNDNNNKNANGAKRAQFLPSKQKNASLLPEKGVRCVVMDTSSLLDADPGMLNLLIEKWKLCIPYTVIDELDNLNKSVIRDARRLTAQQRAEREHRQKRARELRNWLMSVTMRKGNMIRFQKRAEVIEEYFKRSSNNDDAILGFAVFLRCEDANVVFVTEDKFLRLKAQSELGEVLNNKQLKQLLRLRY